MTQVNYNTYQLFKNKELIEETEAATFERAVDYFLDLHPNAYSDTDYSFKRVMMSHER